MGGEATLRAGWTPRARLRPPARAHRAAADGAEGRVEAPRSIDDPRAPSSTAGSPSFPSSSRTVLVVVNDTKVVPARLELRRETGGAVEVLLVESLGGRRWEALARPSRRPRAGERLGSITLVESWDGAAGWWSSRESRPEQHRFRRTSTSRSPTRALPDGLRARAGSAAAPTAGSTSRPSSSSARSRSRARLHVGLDTFRPVEAARSRSTRFTVSGTR
jgi:hypothetical protein